MFLQNCFLLFTAVSSRCCQLRVFRFKTCLKPFSHWKFLWEYCKTFKRAVFGTNADGCLQISEYFLGLTRNGCSVKFLRFPNILGFWLQVWLIPCKRSTKILLNWRRFKIRSWMWFNSYKNDIFQRKIYIFNFSQKFFLGHSREFFCSMID